jgi:hypothetical protein
VASNQGSSPLQAPIFNDDGSVVVTGSLGGVGSAGRSDPGTRILVEPAATFRAKSRIDVAGINTLLPDIASRQDLPAPNVPNDAGRITLGADNPFNWSSRLDLGRSGSGKAGEFDLAMAGAAAIVDDAASPPAATAPNSGLIAASALTSSNAGSILIGGVRNTGTTVAITTTSDRVDLLATKTPVEAGEVILNARSAVNVAAGATLRAVGTADDTARTLGLSGDSALASVSTFTATEITRTYPTGAASTGVGSLTINSGSTVSGPAVRLAATGSLALAAGAALKATTSLGIESAALAVGTPTSATSATVLDGAVLSAIQQVGTLRLTSQGGIDFFGGQTISVDRLVLDTPNLRGLGASGEVLRLIARQVDLRNSTAAVSDTSRTGTMDIVVDAAAPDALGTAGVLTIGQGAQSGTGGLFLGFKTARLNSLGDVVFAGTGLLTAQGDVFVSGARITAQTGSIHGVSAPSGLIALASASGGRTLGDRVGQGASLSFSAQRITQGAWIDTPAGALTFTAAGTASEPVSLSFAPGSITSAAGFGIDASPTWTVYGGAGSIRANATSGQIVVAGRLDVSAPGDANAGLISLAAYGATGGVDVQGTATLAGAGGVGQRQGRISIDAAKWLEDGAASSSLDRLASSLAAGSVGDAVDLRVRSGDLRLSAGSTLRAQQLSLAADQGSIAIDGTLDASSMAGGTVRMAAGSDVKLSGGINARSMRGGGNGGDVLLSSTTGSVVLAATAAIDAGGDDAADGRIVLRSLRNEATGAVAINVDPSVGASRLVAGEIDLEAVRRYTGFATLGTGPTLGTKLGQTTLRAQSLDYFTNASGVLAELGLSSDTRVHLRPGIEIVSAGDFTVSNDWNLWESNRPGGEPGFLSIRAGGNLTLSGSISDGFASAVRPTSTTLSVPTELKQGDAWSYRLVAGADSAAANPLSTLAGKAADVTVAATKLIRTTSGSIEAAASRDIVLAGAGTTLQQGVIYVAGRPSTAITDLSLSSSAWTAQFTAHGGNLALTAGNDIVGAPTTQQFGGWFYHTGSEGTTPTGWWTGFDAYRQGIGNFGGGNVRVSAGRDIRDLGVAVPSSARGPDIGASPSNPLIVENGGNVMAEAGRDLLGGTYFLGRGQGLLSAGRDITVGSSSNAATRPAVAPVLGLIDGKWSLVAGRNAAIATAYNPTMLPSANRSFAGGQRIGDNDAGLFFSYAPQSALSVSSITGGITLAGDLPTRSDRLTMTSYWTSLASSGPVAEQIAWNSKFLNPLAYLPPKVQLAALGADLNIRLPAPSRGLTLFPSASGDLRLYGRQDLAILTNSGTSALYMSDASANQLPGVATPIPAISQLIDEFGNSTFRAPTSVASAGFGALQQESSEPVRLAAGRSIDLSPRDSNGTVILVFPKKSELSAGANILDLNLVGQQFKSLDVTSVVAGGNIIETATGSNNRVTLGGPGSLRIEAGRQLDLGASYGFETVGNLYNSALAANGASITLAAGTKRQLVADNFLTSYLMPPTSGASAADRANAFANAYYTSIGQDPASLGPDALAERATLTQRFATYLQVTGVDDAKGVQARRNSLVRFVIQALGREPLPEQALPTAFDSAWTSFKQLAQSQQVAFASGLLSDLFGKTYLATGKPYADLWNQLIAASGADASRFSGPAFDAVRTQVLFSELNLIGTWASPVPKSGGSTRADVFAMGARAIDLTGLGASFFVVGDIDLVASGMQATAGGNINLLAAGGQVNVGLPGTAVVNAKRPQGVVDYGQGNISAYSSGDFQVNSRKVFVVGQGDITVWSAQGNIDAGRGANTAISVPPLVPVRGPDGDIKFALPATTVGSGIGILKPPTGSARGNIGLFAPNGEVLALDALIRAPGRITLAADVVRGADNILGGSVVGAPVAVPVPSVVAPTSSTSNTESQAAANSASVATRGDSRTRNSLLTVELLGMGAASNDPDCTEQDERDKKCVRPEKK